MKNLQDPLAREVLAWMEKDVESVPWTFATFPSEDFKNYFGDALLEYVQGGKTWDDVVTIVKDPGSLNEQVISVR